jgi:hypothetical protein
VPWSVFRRNNQPDVITGAAGTRRQIKICRDPPARVYLWMPYRYHLRAEFIGPNLLMAANAGGRLFSGVKNYGKSNSD